MKAKKWIALLMIFAMLCTLLAGCKAKPAEESAATDSVVEDTTPDQNGQGNKPSAMPEESEKAPEQKPEQKPEQQPNDGVKAVMERMDKVLEAIQAAAIRGLQQPPKETADDILASIIRPPRKE